MAGHFAATIADTCFPATPSSRGMAARLQAGACSRTNVVLMSSLVPRTIVQCWKLGQFVSTSQHHRCHHHALRRRTVRARRAAAAVRAQRPAMRVVPARMARRRRQKQFQQPQLLHRSIWQSARSLHCSHTTRRSTKGGSAVTDGMFQRSRTRKDHGDIDSPPQKFPKSAGRDEPELAQCTA